MHTIPLYTKVDGIVQHAIKYWKDSCEESLSTKRKRVQFEEESVFVEETELERYGMHHVLENPETFSYALKKTKALMRYLPSYELAAPQHLTNLLYSVHAASDILQDKEGFSVIALQSPTATIAGAGLLIHKEADQELSAHTIYNENLGEGASANVKQASSSWVLRIPREIITKTDKEKALRKCQRTRELLQRIHSSQKVLGVEDPSQEISYIDPITSNVLDRSYITVSKRALGSGEDFFDFVQDRDIPLVAYHLTQGLQASIDAEVCHTDIKPNNILLYDHQDSAGNISITEAKISDFEDALLLSSAEQFVSHNIRFIPHTSYYIGDNDLRRLNFLRCILSEFCKFRTLAYQVTIFQMGLILYELYTKEELSADRTPCITCIDMKAVQQSIDLCSHLTPNQKSILCSMLSLSPDKRPNITRVAESFSPERQENA